MRCINRNRFWNRIVGLSYLQVIMNVEVRTATPEDGELIAWIVLEALDIHEEPSQNMIDVCSQADTLYSWENTRIIMVDGAPVGGMISYPGDNYQRLREKTWPRCWNDDPDVLAATGPECVAGEYYLDSMVIMPAYRGLGLGKILALDAVGIGKRLGYNPIHLLADKHKEGLVKYYEKIGFEIFDSMIFFDHDYWRMKFVK